MLGRAGRGSSNRDDMAVAHVLPQLEAGLLPVPLELLHQCGLGWQRSGPSGSSPQTTHRPDTSMISTTPRLEATHFGMRAPEPVWSESTSHNVVEPGW